MTPVPEPVGTTPGGPDNVLVSRVLPARPVTTMADYVEAGGGRGLEMARKLGPDGVLDEVEASGLRGRGGAGFPAGTKWRTVAGHSASVPATVVVNGAEGEPGTFKDRTLMRSNPLAVVEGALVAALAVRADRVIFALKASFERERRLMEQALEEAASAGWVGDLVVGVAQGPGEYLFGEETALLEVLDGRPPFPRLAPPFRHGVGEVAVRPGQAAGTQMARPGPAGPPPALANNVETMANVAGILAEGADWFRSLGTPESPGTILCTLSGDTLRGGVGEVPLGTPLASVIEAVGGGPRPDRTLVAAMSGVANALVPAELFGTPLTYEDMAGIGSGLGAAGLIVFDDETDMAGVAAGVSRFLSVESCGQCTPCKQDGLAIADTLARVAASAAEEHDLEAVADRVATVADEARCFLAHQHQRVVDSVLRLFPEALRRHLDPDHPAVEPEAIVPILDIDADGRVELDHGQLDKQPDWSYEAVDSGKAPVDRLTKTGPPAAD